MIRRPVISVRTSVHNANPQLLGTGVTDSWDRELLMELSPQWQALGYVHDNGPGGPMTVDDAAAAVLAALTSPVWLRDITAVSDPGRANATY